MSAEKYYSADLTVSLLEVNADSIEKAEAVIRELIDQISKAMKYRIRFGGFDYNIEENVLDEAKGVWAVTEKEGWVGELNSDQ